MYEGTILAHLQCRQTVNGPFPPFQRKEENLGACVLVFFLWRFELTILEEAIESRFSTSLARTMKNVTAVLTTINAPHSEQLDAATLVDCLKDVEIAKSKPGHMSSFFGEVAPAAQKAFCAQFGIDEQTLSSAAKSFANFSGEQYPLAV